MLNIVKLTTRWRSNPTKYIILYSVNVLKTKKLKRGEKKKNNNNKKKPGAPSNNYTCFYPLRACSVCNSQLQSTAVEMSNCRPKQVSVSSNKHGIKLQ